MTTSSPLPLLLVIQKLKPLPFLLGHSLAIFTRSKCSKSEIKRKGLVFVHQERVKSNMLKNWARFPPKIALACPCLAPLANECICIHAATPFSLQLCTFLSFQHVKTAIIPPPPFPSWNNLERHKLHVDTVSLMPAWPPTPELLCPRLLQTESAAAAVQWLH